MCREDGFCHGAGLEQGEAQQNRVAHASPDGLADVCVNGDTLNKGSVNCHTDDNEKCLERQREQGAQVILTHAAALLAEHRCHRDGCNRGHEVNLDHTTVGDDEDADGERPHGYTDKQTLEPQTEQRSKLHCHEPVFQINDHSADIDGGATGDDAASAVYNALAHIENAHDDVPGVRDDQHRCRRLENPLEEHPCVYVTVHIVLVCDHLDQLDGHDESEYATGNRDNDVIRQIADHTVDGSVPCLRGRADLSHDIAHLLVHVVKHSGEITNDAADQYLFQPFDNRIHNHIH